MAQIQNLTNKFGQMAGWNSMKLPIFGREIEGILSVSYDDNMDISAVKGSGVMPIGISDKENYEAKFEMEIYQEEMYAILDALPKGSRISDMQPVDVPVMMEYNDRIRKDVLRSVIITGFGKSLKQGDGTTKVKCKVFLTQIDWNVD